MPGLVQQQHHHRNTTKTNQKPFKPRFTSKNAQRDRSKGRVEGLEKGLRKTQHQQVMSKFDRRNQAKQKRIASHKDHERATNVFSGKDGAPRIVAVLPLCEDVNARGAIEQLNKSLDIEESAATEGYVQVDRFKQRLQYVLVEKDLLSALDACRIADYVLCVVSAQKEVEEHGELILRSIESQGISNVYTAAQHLEKVEPAKRRPTTLTSLKSFITHFFPSQEKVFSLDSRQECQNVVRSLCTTTPKGIRWRDDRSWMYAESAQWREGATKGTDNTEEELGDVVLTGVVRGRNLKADRLVHVGSWGDYRISNITAAPRPQQQRKGKDTAMSADPSEEQVLEQPSEDQDTLDALAPEKVVMDDLAADERMTTASTAFTERKSVLLDNEQDYIDEAGDEDAEAPKRLPKGTSSYQAAWYLGDASDSGSDMEDADEEMLEDAPADQDNEAAPSLVQAGPSTVAASEMMADSEMGEDVEEDGDLADFHSHKHSLSAAEADREFPDEIELPPNVAVRERMARYRGLKSAKTSPWDIAEDKPYEPEDWPRLLDIADYKAAKGRVLRESLVGGVKAGTRVHVHLSGVPKSVWTSHEAQHSSSKPLALYSLLRHEHKRSAIHSTLTLSSDFPRPIKNKEELIAQIGPRRFAINATFSQAGATPNDVHKIQRWAWPGTTVVASWTGPVTWGSVPVVFFTRKLDGDKDSDDEKPEGEEVSMNNVDTNSASLHLLGQGTLLAPSTSRILAKRAVLTGQPYAIHKKLVSIRYMFFNTEDVNYFRSMPLWTNRGRRGQVKESLGTHGQFKGTFDGKINVQEGIAISLWKRQWPRSARLLGEIAEVI